MSGRASTIAISSNGTPRAASRSSWRTMARASPASPGAVSRLTAPSSAGVPEGGSNSASRSRASEPGGGAGASGASGVSAQSASATPRAGEAGAERARAQARRQRPAQDAHRARRRERLDEALLGGVELEVVRDQHVRVGEPGRAREPLARRREQRDGVGGPARKGVVEGPVERRERAQAARVLRAERRVRRERGHALGRQAGAAQLGQRPREGGGERPARRVRRQPQARVARLGRAAAPRAARRGRGPTRARLRPSSTGSASARASSSGFSA